MASTVAVLSIIFCVYRITFERTSLVNLLSPFLESYRAAGLGDLKGEGLLICGEIIVVIAGCETVIGGLTGESPLLTYL